jgi:hypothetical protein
MFGVLADTTESVIMPGCALEILLTNLTLLIAMTESGFMIYDHHFSVGNSDRWM